MSKTTVFGIPNCDTVKKARRWLDDHSVNYEFHDFRKDGLAAIQVANWVKSLGLDVLVNKRSTTWKTLTELQRSKFNEKTAVSLLCENPTLIKRPLIERGDDRTVGFSEESYRVFFG